MALKNPENRRKTAKINPPRKTQFKKKWLKSSTPAKNGPTPSPTVENQAKCEALSSTKCDESVAVFECNVSRVDAASQDQDSSKTSNTSFLSITSSMANAIDIAFNDVSDPRAISGEDPDLLAGIETTAVELCARGEVSTAHSLEEALDIEVFEISELGPDRKRIMDTVLGDGAFSNLLGCLRTKRSSQAQRGKVTNFSVQR